MWVGVRVKGRGRGVRPSVLCDGVVVNLMAEIHGYNKLYATKRRKTEVSDTMYGQPLHRETLNCTAKQWDTIVVVCWLFSVSATC